MGGVGNERHERRTKKDGTGRELLCRRGVEGDSYYEGMLIALLSLLKLLKFVHNFWGVGC